MTYIQFMQVIDSVGDLFPDTQHFVYVEGVCLFDYQLV